jgi:hypothetical protein
MVTHPFCRVEIKLLDLAMAEECGKAHTVIGQVRFLAEDCDIVLAITGIVFENLLTVQYFG